MQTLFYSTDQFNFYEVISTKLQCSNLEDIHLQKEFNYHTVFKRQNDQSTHYHKAFYDLARTQEFSDLYKGFLQEIIKPYFHNREIVYQSIPTFRLHFPQNIAVGEYHRDRNYRDIDWAKKVKETNFFLPFTKAFGTNTIWVESQEGKEDFSPIEVEYGQVVAWDGANLLHGNKTNTETKTRISVDFRVMLKENYLPSTAGSINTKSKFAIGGYYSEM